ncbi:DeoR/GlpR family DNA-binding transcription regulator [Psittacicella hinzii]|nr:DeoR/GlpR family DNA-binding transcription regulator [Psittacicella hinzii]
MRPVQLRRQNILNLVNSIGIVSISHLATYFNVSKVTIRADVDILDKSKQLIKMHGCIKSLNFNDDDTSLLFDQKFSFNQKRKFQHEIKNRLSLYALNLVEDNSVIMLDSGTTIYELAVQISKKSRKNLTIVTSSLPICDLLSSISGITLVLLGGKLHQRGRCFIGEEAKAMLVDLEYDKLFLAVDGYHVDYGLTSQYEEEADLKYQMIQQANKVIVLSDHTKFGRHSKYKIVDFDIPDIVITDEQINPEYLKHFAKYKTNLIIVR